MDPSLLVKIIPSDRISLKNNKGLLPCSQSQDNTFSKQYRIISVFYANRIVATYTDTFDIFKTWT